MHWYEKLNQYFPVEEMIYEAMKKTYDIIHTFKDHHFYGKFYESVDDVLTFSEETEHKNILDKL